MSAGVHQYEDKLLDYAYGELPAHEASAVDAHVRTCAKCSQALEQIKGVRSVFAPLPMVAAPDAGLESLLAYADQHARRAKTEKQAPWRRWIFAFSSAAALLVVGVVAVRASKESPQSAMDIVAGAEKETRKLDSPKSSSPAPVAAAPVADNDLAPTEAKQEPQVWDERTGKRGLAEPNSEEYANKADALQEKAPVQKKVRLDESVAKNDKAPPAEKPVALEALAAGRKGGEGDVGGAVGGAVARQSEGKRQAPAKEAEAQGGLVQDFANSRGGYVGDLAKDAKTVTKREEKANVDDQLNDGASVKQSMKGTASPPGYGVSAGSGSGAVAYGQFADGPKGNAEQVRSQAAPPPPPAQAPAAPVAKPAQKSKVAENYGLMPRPSSADSAGEDAPQAVTETSVGDSTLRRQRDQQLTVEAQLVQSRAASNQGDRRGQVAAAVRALSAGATGYARAEALKSACDGYEALGEYDRAQQFCDLLLSEFRGTAAAQQVAQRRKAQLKAPAAAPARQSADFESDDKKPADVPAAAH